MSTPLTAPASAPLAHRPSRARLAAAIISALPGIAAPLALALSAGVAPPALARTATQPQNQTQIQAQPAQPRAADLPIRAITLYRSGVGYFERRGVITGDRTIQLRFATDQMNDILKSLLVLVDARSGRIQSVAYTSREPLERRLASFGINIADNPSAAEILNRLRGSPVSIRTDEGDTAGTILNVEQRPTVFAPTTPGSPTTVVPLPWINLMTPEGVRSINLTRAVGFQILDPTLRQELEKALAALAEHRADRVKTVDVTLAGQGDYQAAIGYIHEMPMWKTSYRLVLPAAAQPGSDPAPLTIQGWAQVENTTDEDWENVQLALVAGRPISFTMDLYEPLRVARPEIPVPVVGGVIPRLYQVADQIRGQIAGSGGGQARAARQLQRQAVPSAEMAAAGRPGGDVAEPAMPPELYAPDPVAQAGEVGEVFQYQLREPVSIARQRSAMLPILAAPIQGKRVSIFNRADGSLHPLRGVMLTNTTGLQLMPGPVTVIDGTAYAGDAQIAHVSIGDKRLLSYAIDLDVTSRVTDEATSTVRSVKIVRGSVITSTRHRQTITYAFTNRDTKRDRTILVEHANPGSEWELVAAASGTVAPKPIEQTQTFLRFELDLKAGERGSLPLAFELTSQSSVAVLDADPGTIIAHARDGKASPAVVDAMRRVAQLQSAVADTRRAIARLDEEQRSIDQDQSRIRQNMGAVGRDTDLYRRYAARLAEQENRLEQLRADRQQQVATLERQETELLAFVQNLSAE